MHMNTINFETLIAAVMEGDDLSEQDRIDLRPILTFALNSEFKRSACASIIRILAGRCYNWRIFLTETNAKAFFGNPAIQLMIDLSTKVTDRVDFEAEFIEFLARQFAAMFGGNQYGVYRQRI